MTYWHEEDETYRIKDERWWTIKVPWPEAVAYLMMLALFLWIVSIGVINCPR
jgi:hypothetical protein